MTETLALSIYENVCAGASEVESIAFYRQRRRKPAHNPAVQSHAVSTFRATSLAPLTSSRLKVAAVSK
jgi:hypothetical protein